MSVYCGAGQVAIVVQYPPLIVSPVYVCVCVWVMYCVCIQRIGPVCLAAPLNSTVANGLYRLSPLLCVSGVATLDNEGYGERGTPP